MKKKIMHFTDGAITFLKPNYKNELCLQPFNNCYYDPIEQKFYF